MGATSLVNVGTAGAAAAAAGDSERDAETASMKTAFRPPARVARRRGKQDYTPVDPDVRRFLAGGDRRDQARARRLLDRITAGGGGGVRARPGRGGCSTASRRGSGGSSPNWPG